VFVFDDKPARVNNPSINPDIKTLWTPIIRRQDERQSVNSDENAQFDPSTTRQTA